MNENCVPIASEKNPQKRVRPRWRRKTTRTTRPSLRFSPTAWAKLLFLRDYGETEVGGFGLSAENDLLLMEDIRLVTQTCSWAHVAFEDTAVADFFDEQVDAGRQPEQFARIWMHTHPGDCPQPSATDEQTFERVFGRSEWAMMFILAQGGKTFARLRFNVGPGIAIKLPVNVDYTRPFDGCDLAGWEQEYLEHVQALPPVPNARPSANPFVPAVSDPYPMDPWSEHWLGDALDQDFLRGLIR
jgi:hypothetical protein